ncbi:hypothetical protein EIN_151320 [Entamoeba invadens IP1]|uniref:Rab-GAP TBC domain-containing protein n=1 Tax=Entamoeba invadens IP1 TaxID=370355 RepID=A0A0A1U8H1_ENTIV|nr:hypothetical protein EIN_151320 [Entamoeba invadens IP1]ELP91235.1 hypothetical protein EIN_151320 [Entamoeba invadens IP1]|eukprot:XP_004258006.1 hypothetical protein EIN_151320 [Entamoeba invadens IP1]
MNSTRQNVEELFIGPEIDVSRLRVLLISGKLDPHSKLRSKVWQILLGYLPPNQLTWGEVIQQKTQQYKTSTTQVLPSIVGTSDFLDCPQLTPKKCTSPLKQKHSPLLTESQLTFNSEKSGSESDKNSDDEGVLVGSSHSFEQPNPVLNLPERSQSSAAWFSPRGFFDSIIRSRSNSTPKKEKCASTNATRSQLRTINNDVPRTATLLKFPEEEAEIHRNALRRILYTLLCVDNIKYTQGENEIAAVLYYVFAVTPNIIDYYAAEVAAYYCMKTVMGEYSHYFNEKEDDKPEGINTAMNEVMRILREEDNELYNNMKTKNVENALYLLRWISLMMAEELPTDSLILLWDRLLTDLKSKKYLMYFCVSMLLSVKEEIMSTGFCGTLKILQKFPRREFNDLDMFTRYMIKYPKKVRDPYGCDRISSPLSVFMTSRIPKRSCTTPSGFQPLLFTSII